MVWLTAPADGSAFQQGTRVPLAASADDANSGGSGVARVAFYDGSTLLGTDTSAPYGLTWNTRKVTTGPENPHTLTARATDGAGNTATSAQVRVTINSR
jgi:hypothetical protein